MELFDKLESYGVISANKVSIQQISRMSFAKLLDFTDEVSSLLSKPPLKKNENIFIHTASISLGGGRDECMAYECRQKKLFELSHYAALYSDKVFIDNFLSNYSPEFGHPPKTDSVEFRNELLNDIKLYLSIKPLIENGIIIPYNPAEHCCQDCLSKRIFGSKGVKVLKKIKEDLATKILVDVKIQFLSDDLGNALIYSANEDYFETRERWSDIDKIPSKLRKYPHIINKIKKSGSAEFSQNIKKELGYHKELSNEFIGILLHQMFISQIFKTSFLTHRPLDIKILNEINGTTKQRGNNILLANHLHTIVPFAYDVPINKLLKLRYRENDSFIEFRNSLTLAINEFTNNPNITKKSIQSFYSDVIAPKLLSMDKKINKAKKDLTKSLASSIVAGFGTIAFGQFSGLSTNEIMKIAEFLGISEIFRNLVTTAPNLIDTQKVIKDENYYFLWKVRELGRRKNPLRNILV